MYNLLSHLAPKEKKREAMFVLITDIFKNLSLSDRHDQFPPT